MITMDSKQFEGKEFALQILSKGSFIDPFSQPNKNYLVEATTIRLNWVALSEWQDSVMQNVRECYEDGEAGDAEWKAHIAEYEEKRRIVKEKILSDLGINLEKRGVIIVQNMAEVFTVVRTQEV